MVWIVFIVPVDLLGETVDMRHRHVDAAILPEATVEEHAGGWGEDAGSGSKARLKIHH